MQQYTFIVAKNVQIAKFKFKSRVGAADICTECHLSFHNHDADSTASLVRRAR